MWRPTEPGDAGARAQLAGLVRQELERLMRSGALNQMAPPRSVLPTMLRDGMESKRIAYDNGDTPTSTGILRSTNVQAALDELAATKMRQSVVDAKGDLIVGVEDNKVIRVGTGGAPVGSVLENDPADVAGVKWSTTPGLKSGIVDAKGDLLVGTANDAVARLPAGANHRRLKADSAAASGLAYEGVMVASSRRSVNQTISGNTWTQVVLDAVYTEADPAVIDATTTGYITVKRTGYYAISGQVMYLAPGVATYQLVRLDTTAGPLASGAQGYCAAGTWAAPCFPRQIHYLGANTTMNLATYWGHFGGTGGSHTIGNVHSGGYDTFLAVEWMGVP